MTKSTPKQRRENKPNKVINHEHEQLVSNTIKYVYPDANVINMTTSIHSSDDILISVKKLNKFLQDNNNIIIIFNINTQIVNDFYSNYIQWKKAPTAICQEVKDNIALMIVRGSNVLLYPTSELNTDTMSQVLKSQLKPSVKECLICFHEFVFNEKRVTCCHCQMPMCGECFGTYVKSNSGWCPYCTLHIMYSGLRKMSSESNDLNNMFDAFISKEMMDRINQTNSIVTTCAKPIIDNIFNSIIKTDGSIVVPQIN